MLVTLTGPFLGTTALPAFSLGAFPGEQAPRPACGTCRLVACQVPWEPGQGTGSGPPGLQVSGWSRTHSDLGLAVLPGLSCVCPA